MSQTLTQTTPETKVIPNELATLVRAATAALDDGDLRGALDKFEAVVSAFPDRPEGYNNLGALHSSIGNYDKAEECFTRVVEMLPENANVIYNRGVVRSHLKQFATARSDFNRVLELTPEDPDTLNNLGVASYMEGQFSAARKHFLSAMNARPGFVNAALNHIDLECTAGNTTEAIKMCTVFLAKHTSIEVEQKHLELLVLRCNQTLTKAATTAEAILVADPENESVQTELKRINAARSTWQGTTATTI